MELNGLLPFTHWHWLTIGLLLMGGELVVPGIFLFWEGLGAVLTGLLLFLFPDLGWKTQVVAFAFFSSVCTAGNVIYTHRRKLASEGATLNARSSQYVGRSADLIEPIHDGVGAVRIDDTRWRVEGPDLPEGTRVRIVGAKGATLLVEPEGKES
ncbi:MAG: NfeD family protein [Caldilineae bacterium]|nr:MAG: NfeD family protein [Caldilineae bacterium]